MKTEIEINTSHGVDVVFSKEPNQNKIRVSVFEHGKRIGWTDLEGYSQLRVLQYLANNIEIRPEVEALL